MKTVLSEWHCACGEEAKRNLVRTREVFTVVYRWLLVLSVSVVLSAVLSVSVRS